MEGDTEIKLLQVPSFSSGCDSDAAMVEGGCATFSSTSTTSLLSLQSHTSTTIGVWEMINRT